MNNEDKPTKRQILGEIDFKVSMARFDGIERGRWQFATLGVLVINLALTLATWLLLLQTSSEVKYLRENVAVKTNE